MTSPVDTSVKYFHSNMPGAPVLQTVTGSLIALLDACLVNGFGALTLTSLSVSAGVATAAFAGTFPALQESVVQIAGATGAWSDLNGEQKVTALGGGTFKFATALPSGSATGTITAKMAPAGWGIPFTGTNLRAYRSNDLTSTARHFFRVSDASTAAVPAARVVGYETMTAISSGTNLFPTNAQQSGGLYWNHGYAGAAEVVSLNWTIVANQRRVYLYIAYGMSANYGGSAYDGEVGVMFGEFASLKSTVDAYNSFLTGGRNVNGQSSGPSQLVWAPQDPSLVIARSHTNAVGAQFASYDTGITRSSGVCSGQAGDNFGPLNGVMNRMVLQQPVLAIDIGNNGPRGYLPEVFLIPQSVPASTSGLSKGEITVGAGIAAGKKLLAVSGTINLSPVVTTQGRAVTLFDVTGPWA